MGPSQQIVFPPFRVDLLNERLWCNAEPRPLPPKAFAVLRCLLQHRGRLVTKQELLDTVWPAVHVGDAVLKIAVRQIRLALEDSPKSPRFIETSSRRGYSFIGHAVEVEADRPAAMFADPPPGGTAGEQPPAAQSPASALPPHIVEREDAAAALDAFLSRALRGERQIVFVTGEPGIGKTSLVNAFAKRIDTLPGILVARGQCLEHFGVGEPYLPMLDALGRLSRTAARPRIVAALRQYAPTWLVQLPSLASVMDRDELQREIFGATRQRMLREMGEAVEALTEESPLVLVLEDLQWADYSTLDLISFLARRFEPARLLLVGTYRPADLLLSQHPLRSVKEGLELHGRCRELPLAFLSESAVSAYLHARFPRCGFPPDLARALHRRTDGSPLFLVNVVDHLVKQGLIASVDEEWRLLVPLDRVAVAVPDTLRQMVDEQVDALAAEERGLLEAASVAGMEFSPAAVAAALDRDSLVVEELSDALVRRRQFLRPAGTGDVPHGMPVVRYEFIHALYRDVLYRRIPASRRRLLHQRIGEFMEAAYRHRGAEAAAELAAHFDQARDYARAVQYLRQAAENATRRYANREAIDYLTQALQHADQLPPGEQPTCRTAMLEQRGFARRSAGDMRGAADDFLQAASFARQQRDLPATIGALLYAASALSWFERDRCLAVAGEAQTLSAALADQRLRAHVLGDAAYWDLLWNAWRDDTAQACAAAVDAMRAAGDRAALGVHLRRYAFVQSLRSDYRAACAAAEEGRQLAMQAGDSFDCLLCQFFWAWALFYLGRWNEMLRVLRDASEMADRNGHHLWSILYRVELAWLHLETFGFERARELSARSLADAQRAGHSLSELASQVLLGLADLGLQDVGQAHHRLQSIAERLGRERVLMDWIWEMPLRYGLSRCWLARGELHAAADEANRLCAIAKGPGERTWLGLSRTLAAEISLMLGDRAHASAMVDEALQAIERADAPIATWRVHAVAARLHAAAGNSVKAECHGAASAAVLRRLLDSLAGADDLRATFLAQPAVQEILLSRIVPFPV